jgi:hypothetical protein
MGTMPGETSYDPWGRARNLLHSLIQRQGLAEGEYALFFVSAEGEFLPISTPESPVEEASGYVVDR